MSLQTMKPTDSQQPMFYLDMLRKNPRMIRSVSWGVIQYVLQPRIYNMKIQTHDSYFAEVARVAKFPICTIGKVQNLPQNDGFDPAAERRSSRAVPDS